MATKKTAKRSSATRRAAVLGDRVRAKREKLNLTQTDLAAALGIHATKISLIENGRQDILCALLVQLVRALDESADHLLGLD